MAITDTTPEFIMRCTLPAVLAALILTACSQQEAPPVDSSAAAAAPAMLMASDLAGTYAGVSMAMDSDSILSRWTVVSPTGMGGMLVMDGSTDSIPYTTTYDADSVMIVTTYPDPSLPGSPEVTFRGVGRMVGNKLVGTGVTTLTSNPDSVISRERIESTRVP